MEVLIPRPPESVGPEESSPPPPPAPEWCFSLDGLAFNSEAFCLATKWGPSDRKIGVPAPRVGGHDEGGERSFSEVAFCELVW